MAAGVSDQRDADELLLRTSGRKAEALALARPDRSAADPLQQLMGCPAPIWENQPESKASDGRCVIFLGPKRCPGQAAHAAWIGCETGEHLDKSEVCEIHAEQLERLRASTRYSCRRCWDAIGEISWARVIRIERIDDDHDDDERAAAAAGPGRRRPAAAGG